MQPTLRGVIPLIALLRPSHGPRAHDWFLGMMRTHDEFEVETDEPGEWPVPFWSETVRQVVVE